MSAEVITSSEGLHDLEDEWRGLLRNSDADGLFMTWEYASAWWEQFGNGKQLRLVVFREGPGEVCGIAPLMLGVGNTLARQYVKHLSFIGQLNESLTEYQELAVRKGDESVVAEAMAQLVLGEMRNEWEVLYFPVIREGSVVMGFFQEELEKRGFPAAKIFVRKSPNAALGESWEAFLAKLSRNSRKKVKLAEKRFERDFEHELLVAGVDIPVDEAMEVLEELNSMRWGDAARSFKTREFGVFHRRLAKDFVERGWLSLLLLRGNGEFVAAQYDIYGNKAWGFQGGWRSDLAGYSIGKVMMAKALRRYIGLGLEEYDFLAGEADYKDSWSDDERMVYDLELANRESVRGLAFGLMRDLLLGACRT
ncbi:MAG: GNAT family N-acetyltransferase [Verrucomicrobiales bacterium]|nr:GNAT family N-acetyltransferase [Verrucomicrobiales bacterium]